MKPELQEQAKTLSKLFYNGDLSFSVLLQRLNELNSEQEEIESEEEYQESLRDCLGTPEAFQYKGKV